MEIMTQRGWRSLVTDSPPKAPSLRDQIMAEHLAVYPDPIFTPAQREQIVNDIAALPWRANSVHKPTPLMRPWSEVEAEINTAVDAFCARVDAWMAGDLDYERVFPIFRNKTKL